MTHLNDHTLDYLLEGFQLIGFDWRYLYVNDAVVRQSKYAREELLGFTMLEKYPGIEQTEMFRTLERCMVDRTPSQIESEFVYPDQSTSWFELHVQPVPEGIFVLSIDITRRKQVEEELIRLNESLEEQVALRTRQLEIRNKDILDSLHYAKNIQKAFLPNPTEFHRLFPKALLINQPKDIVSGDFYWYRDLGNRVLIAAADCTGHGVPGALMSMIGIEKLNNIALKTSDPAEILRQLNRSIKIAMSSPIMRNRCLDGMDIAVCSIDRLTGHITYSGAQRPLWYVRRDEEEMHVVKPTKHAIGGHTGPYEYFERHELQLQPGDTLYLFSDGYPDTFGQETQKKLTTKRFREILLEIRDRTMPEQEIFLHEFIDDWKGEMEQIDDILVIGVRL